MPLINSGSKKAFGENIAIERNAGKPEKQSVAIAYSKKREADRKMRTHVSKKMRSHEGEVGHGKSYYSKKTYNLN